MLIDTMITNSADERLKFQADKRSISIRMSHAVFEYQILNYISNYKSIEIHEQ